MARREVEDEPEHLDRWLVSYADFITLTLAFFVVMYSISAVNEGKYRILSSTLSDAFHSPQSSLDPMQVGDLARADPEKTESIVELHSGSGAINPLTPTQQASQELEDIQLGLEDSFEGLINDGLISVTGNEVWVEIEMRSGLLFNSGSAEPGMQAEFILTQIARIIRDYPNPLQVEGFTDNVPINTAQYPSNWELSAARAGAAVRLLMEAGVAPGRMAAVGYGEHQPVADNASEEGRSQNRRVVLVISRNQDIRRSTAGLDRRAAGAGGSGSLPLQMPIGESPIVRGSRRGLEGAE